MTAFRIEHIGLAADDTELLASWYAKVLGFGEFHRTEGAPPIIFLEDASGVRIEIYPRKEGEYRPAPEERMGAHLAVAVEDYAKAVALLESRGVRFETEARPVFAGGTARFFRDPEGNRLHIIYRPVQPWGGTA